MKLEFLWAILLMIGLAVFIAWCGCAWGDDWKYVEDCPMNDRLTELEKRLEELTEPRPNDWANSPPVRLNQLESRVEKLEELSHYPTTTERKLKEHYGITKYNK